mmetsp:Transcript_11145/g.29658  ORF Transcript_11145/g.29658 Transcript_11145/m.29658 type:complete len:537 (+) Transcript_11145:61-1671(+)
MAVLPQRPSKAGQGMPASRGQAGRVRCGTRTAPCPWCRQPLPPAYCAGCVNRAARQGGQGGQAGRPTDAANAAAAEASQRALAASLAQWSRRLTLRERRVLLLERVSELRAASERQTTGLRLRRRQLEERREDLLERRRRHEARAAEWAVARRRFETKRSRVSRDEFLRDPSLHSTTLGAFHMYQELSVVAAALQAERRRRCVELLAVFPLKWIVSGGAVSGDSDQTVTLGQVQAFPAAGVLQDEELKDMEAALTFLVPLVSTLAAYLDVTLPFPCFGSQGRIVAGPHPHSSAASSSRSSVPMVSQHGCDVGGGSTGDGGSAVAGAIGGHSVGGIVSGCGAPAMAEFGAMLSDRDGAAIAAPGRQHRGHQWTLPCVLHPFAGRWHYFSVYDNICTSDFATAIRLVDEDLRRLCSCQGEAPPAHLGTLQLLACLLSAVHLGCTSPPWLGPAAARNAPDDVSAGSATCGSSMSVAATASPRAPQGAGSRLSPRGDTSATGAGGRSSIADPASGEGIVVYEDGDWTVVEHEYTENAGRR